MAKQDKSPKTDDVEKPQVEEESPPVEDDDMAAKVAAAEKRADEAEEALRKSRDKGPPDVRNLDKKKGVERNADGTIKRPDQLMRTHLDVAMHKKTKDLDEADKVAIEREIRRYVRRGGGWRENLPEEKKAVGRIYLKKLGRDTENPQWDPRIRVPGISA